MSVSLRLSSWKAQSNLTGQLSHAWEGTIHLVSATALPLLHTLLRWYNLGCTAWHYWGRRLHRCDITTLLKSCWLFEGTVSEYRLCGLYPWTEHFHAFPSVSHYLTRLWWPPKSSLLHHSLIMIWKYFWFLIRALKISNLSNHISVHSCFSKAAFTPSQSSPPPLLYVHTLSLSLSHTHRHTHTHTPWSEALQVPPPPCIRVPCQCLRVKRGGGTILWSWKETNTMRKTYVNSYQVNLRFQITVTLSWCASLLPLSSLAVCLVNLAVQCIPKSFICQPSLVPSSVILRMTNMRLKYNPCYLLCCLWTATQTR